MASCLETFCESGWQGVPLQKLVDQLHPAFECEGHRCSPFSPGPVADSEDVIFLLVNPTHYDAVTGMVVPTAFQEVTNRDLSLLRSGVATADDVDGTIAEIISNAMKRVPPKLRSVDFGCFAAAVSIRQVKHDGERMFAVYDTALPTQASHASVFTHAKVHDCKKLRAKARSELHRIFSSNIQSIGSVKQKCQATVDGPV